MDTKFEGSFIVLLRVTLWFSLFSVCGTTDVYMNCPADPWVIGNQVTFHCFVLKTAYPSRCTSANRDVQFRRSPTDVAYTATCSLDDVDNSCTSSSPACSCSNSNSTHFDFQYTFSLAADSSGYWQCNVPCLNGITPQLTYSSSAGCKNRSVKAGPCDDVNCNSGTCYVDDGNQAKCNCSGTNSKGDFCNINKCHNNGPCEHGTCGIMENNDVLCDCTGTRYVGKYCNGDLSFAVHLMWVSSFVVVFMVFFIAGFLCGFLVALTWKVCLLARTDDIRQTLTSEQTKRRIRDFIKQNFVCCCHGIHVELGANCTEDGLVTITLKHRLIWVYCLRDMPSKVEEFIKTEILLEVKPVNVYSNEPDADYPPGPPMAQPKYTGKGNGQPKKSKSDKEIPLSTVGRSSPPSETSGDEKTRMIPTTKARALPVPANQHEPTSIGIGKSASPRLDPLKQDHSKMTSVERNSGAFSRELPSPVRSPLGPIPSGKQS